MPTSVLLATAFLALPATPAQTRSSPDSLPWISPEPLAIPMVPTRPLVDVAMIGDTLFAIDVGHAGPYTGPSAVIGAVAGDVVMPWPLVDGQVFVTIADGSGGWYLGGRFALVDSDVRHNLAHVAADGTLLPFAPRIEGGDVHALALDGDILYVGGSFESVELDVRDHLAAVDATTGALLPWNPNAGEDWTFQERVRALAVSDGVVFVGGDFEAALGGAARRHLGAVDAASGIALAWDPDPDLRIADLELVGGRLAVCGDFTSIAGSARTSLAVFDVASQALDPFAPHLGGEVVCLASVGSTLYACGQVDAVDGSIRLGGAAFDLSTGATLGWDPRVMGQFQSGTIQACAAGPEGVFVAGDFDFTWAQRRRGFARLHAVTGQPAAWTAHVGGLEHDVFALAYGASRLAVGGNFSHVGGELRRGAAAWNLGDGALLPWAPVPSGVFRAIAADASHVYLGGLFGAVNGVVRGNVAKVDPVTAAVILPFHVPGSFHPSDHSVNELEVGHGRLYASGVFDLAGGAMRNLAALDATTGAPVPGFATMASLVEDLALSGDGARLYVGGRFSSIGLPQVPIQGLASLDAATGAVASWDPMLQGPVHRVVRAGAALLLGGNFVSVGGQPIQYLARIEQSSASPAPWPVQFTMPGTDPLSGTARYGSAVFVSRETQFEINGLHRNGLGAVHGRTGATLAWDPELDRAPVLMRVIGHRLIVTGLFRRASGVRQPILAVYALSAAPPR